MEIGDLVFERWSGTKGTVLGFKPGYVIIKPFPRYSYILRGTNTDTLTRKRWMVRELTEDELNDIDRERHLDNFMFDEKL